MKSREKRIGRIIAFCMALILAFNFQMPTITNASAKVKPMKVSIGLNKSYTQYDATGDGKKDTIKTEYREEGTGGHGTVGYLKVYINGKRCLNVKDGDIDRYYIQLVRISTGEVFFVIRAEGVTAGNLRSYKLYKYRSQKLEMVLDVLKLRKTNNWYDMSYLVRISLKEIKGNILTFRWTGDTVNQKWDTVYKWNGKKFTLTDCARSYKGEWRNQRFSETAINPPNILIDVRKISGNKVTFDYSKGTYKAIAFKEGIVGTRSGNKVSFTFRDNWGNLASGYFQITNKYLQLNIKTNKIASGARMSPEIKCKLYRY